MTLRIVARTPLSTNAPPLYLAPALASTPNTPPTRTQFSSSALLCQRKGRRDGNPDRGVSALRRTGLKFPVGMSNHPLPKPVLDPKKRSKVQVDPDHGLWDFFNKDKTLLTKPKDVANHGQGWTPQALRNKSWEDLHQLWYICCKERNQLATETYERRRLKAGAGALESRKRDREIRMTQKSIKHALTERWYAWQDAYRMAEKDPQINLDAGGQTPAYLPRYDEQMESSVANSRASPQ